jgi:hypothetical protein
MSRARLLITLAIAAAAIAVAVLLATDTLSGSGKGGAAAASSPTCLPSTLNHDARLPGTAIDVSPAPETGTANPHTQVSFLGLPGARIRDVSVVGGHKSGHPKPTAAPTPVGCGLTPKATGPASCQTAPLRQVSG